MMPKSLANLFGRNCSLTQSYGRRMCIVRAAGGASERLTTGSGSSSVRWPSGRQAIRGSSLSLAPMSGVFVCGSNGHWQCTNLITHGSDQLSLWMAPKQDPKPKFQEGWWREMSGKNKAELRLASARGGRVCCCCGCPRGGDWASVSPNLIDLSRLSPNGLLY